MEYRFYITKEKVEDLDSPEWEAFERAQDGDLKMYRLRPVLARFMVDESNKPVPYQQALKQTEKLKVKHYKDFLNQFFSTMQNVAIPKANGSESRLPSDQAQADSPSQDGSQP